MKEMTGALFEVYEGWETYETSLANAIRPLSREQLAWKPKAELRSVGQIAGHIIQGRLEWFARMGAPGCAELMQKAATYQSVDEISENAAQLVDWLEATWGMIENTLRTWQVSDLQKTYLQEYMGATYAVSRQWTIWRILAHDLHHGGEIALMLGMQGLPAFELGDLGGHLNMPPLAEN